MTWNYRVFRHATHITDELTDVSYSIHEAYYQNPDDMIPHSWSTEAVSVHSESPAGLFSVLQMMAKAITQPVLEVDGNKVLEVKIRTGEPGDTPS